MPETVEMVPPELRTVVESEQWRDRLARADRGISAAVRSVKPSLDLVLVRPDVDEEVLPPGAVPGRWHVRDRAALPLPFFMPITDANGCFREPDSGVVVELWRADMRKHDVAQAVFGRSRRLKDERTKATALKREQMNDDARADLRAGWRVKGRIYNDQGEPVKRKVA